MLELLRDAELREAIRGVDLPRLQRATATARAHSVDAGLLKEAEARAAHLNASVAEVEKRVAAARAALAAAPPAPAGTGGVYGGRRARTLQRRPSGRRS